MGKQWKTAGKEVQASKKGALFTKLSREIQVAVRLAGPYPENNSRLKLALEVARSYSLPKDTIKRAIHQGKGSTSEDQIEEVIYEGFGPYGVAMIVICLTNNRARTASEVRFIFKKHKGNMGESGSVMWMFEKVALAEAHQKAELASKIKYSDSKKSVHLVTKKSFSDDSKKTSVEELAILAGAEDIEQKGDIYTFYGKWEKLSALRENLIKQQWEVIKAEPAYRAKTKITLNKNQKQDLEDLLKVFTANPDCKAVWTNME